MANFRHALVGSDGISLPPKDYQTGDCVFMTRKTAKSFKTSRLMLNGFF